MAALIGQTLGQYRLEALIGRGGMASVYRARQESMDRDVAVKVMAAELAHNAEFVARFEREARVIARLQHPHILPVIDFGRHGDHVYLVMQLIDGGMLSDRLRQTSLSLAQVARFLTQIASALHYAHQRGIVHRDLKPNNVLLDALDNVYLTDFGIAKMLAGTTTTAQSLTATGSVMGTPAYMAPEQWRSEPVDARTDIYALGVILFEMLLGTLPFQADTPFSMMYKHFDTPPPPLCAVNPDLPPALEAVVLRAMAKNPADRYPSAQQMADDFARAVAGLPPDTTQQPLPRATPEQIERVTPPAGQRAAATPPVPPPGIAPPVGTPPADRSWIGPAEAAPVPGARRERGRGWLVGAALAIVVIVGALVIALLTQRGAGPAPPSRQDDMTQTALAALAQVPSPTLTVGLVILTPGATETPASPTELPVTATDTDTPAPTLTVTPSPTVVKEADGLVTVTPWPLSATETDTATATSVPPSLTQTSRPTALAPSPTASPTASVTPRPTDIFTLTFTPSPTASVTPRPTDTFTPTFTPSPTPDLNATAAALVALRLTQTAQSWTDTPTPDIEASVVAALTGTAAAWTDTPSPTFTWTPSYTPSPTPTPTSTLSPTPSVTPSPTRTPRPTATPRPTRPPSCNEMPFRMKVGEGGRTTLLPAVPTNVRTGPGLSSPRFQEIPPGQMFEVIGGPQCADNIAWWQITVYDRSGLWTGWIGEGQNGTYWIEPFDTGPVSCSGALPPRLVPGKTGRVTFTPPVPSNVRSAPRVTSDNVIGQLQPGQQFTVVSGPVCDQERLWRWWLVRTPRLEGWVSEGQPGQYWLEPWP